MRIVFWGTPEFAVKCLNQIHNSGNEIVSVITQPDRKRGRGKALSFSPIKKRSLELNLNVLSPLSLKSDVYIKNQLTELQPDIFVVVAYGQILPKDILEIPKYGSWNVHASLLPRWRGSAPIQWSLIEGDKHTGVGIMRMEEGLDTGPILTQKSVEIKPDDNYYSLSNKLSILASRLITDAIQEIKEDINFEQKNNLSKLSLTEQESTGLETRYATMIQKLDYEINWSSKSINIHRKTKALYPNAYTFYNNKRLKILCTKILDQELNKELINYNNNIIDPGSLKKYTPGQIIGKIKEKGILVATKDIPIVITEAKFEGKQNTFGNSLIQQMGSFDGTSFS